MMAIYSFKKYPILFFIDFVYSLAALGIAQASLALLSFAKEFFIIHSSLLPIRPLSIPFPC